MQTIPNLFLVLNMRCYLYTLLLYIHIYTNVYKFVYMNYTQQNSQEQYYILNLNVCYTQFWVRKSWFTVHVRINRTKRKTPSHRKIYGCIITLHQMLFYVLIVYWIGRIRINLFLLKLRICGQRCLEKTNFKYYCKNWDEILEHLN